VSPTFQLGIAASRFGGWAGWPSAVSSLNRNAIQLLLPGAGQQRNPIAKGTSKTVSTGCLISADGLVEPTATELRWFSRPPRLAHADRRDEPYKNETGERVTGDETPNANSQPLRLILKVLIGGGLAAHVVTWAIVVFFIAFRILALLRLMIVVKARKGEGRATMTLRLNHAVRIRCLGREITTRCGLGVVSPFATRRP
jgi:hypothetical protein